MASQPRALHLGLLPQATYGQLFDIFQEFGPVSSRLKGWRCGNIWKLFCKVARKEKAVDDPARNACCVMSVGSCAIVWFEIASSEA